jgi:hypothetical protein
MLSGSIDSLITRERRPYSYCFGRVNWAAWLIPEHRYSDSQKAELQWQMLKVLSDNKEI